MSDKVNIPNIERLLEVLNAYGVNSEKWPHAERAGLEILLDQERPTNATLRSEYDAARSLDQLLTNKSATLSTISGADILSLSGTIMARVEAEISPASKSELSNNTNRNNSAVVDLGTFKKAQAANADRPQNQVQASATWRDITNWRTAALLAATFVFGIYIGATLISEPTVEGVTALAGGNNSPTIEFTLFQDQQDELFGEDL